MLSEEYGVANDFQKDFIKLQKALNSEPANWKLPASHHVTQLFIGGNKAALNNEIYKSYEEGLPVDVLIKAVIYVPEKILAAICFPNAACNNKYPHLTLATAGAWKPVNSNTILTNSVESDPSFGAQYNDLKNGKASQQEQQVIECSNLNVQLARNKVEKVDKTYMIVFPPEKQIKFAGKQKYFF